jgi:hypothetical protein
MRIQKCILLSFIIFITYHEGFAQDTIAFSGQLSSYIHYNGGNDLPWMSGVRYIPQFNFGHRLNNQNLIDLEASLNLYGNVGVKSFDNSDFSGDIKPYRLWARYSSDQFELRAGLQKINFGSASLLRPLMWFDQIDPRDPLKLTDGVWGVLARYYFLNNANIWLWGLYGNGNLKGWETVKSNKKIPEFGGRFQVPLTVGEAALSYHHRVADGTSLPESFMDADNIPENRLGVDAKFDMAVGWWFEASWSHFSSEVGSYSDQSAINIGTDYTFRVGNGLTVTFEQLLASFDKNPFGFRNVTTFSLLNLTYPISMFDNLSAIFYYDWTNNKAYNFLNWQKKFNKITLYVMGYINPDLYNIPTQESGEMLYSGSGIQIMLVFNH